MKGKVNLMALQIRKKITVEGESVVDGIVVQGYRAELNEDNPENLVMSDWIVNQALYKANRSAVRADLCEFEDTVFAIQDEMLAAQETEQEA